MVIGTSQLAMKFINYALGKVTSRCFHLHPTLLKTGKFKGCVTTEILIVGSTRPVASIFKLKSIEGGCIRNCWAVENRNGK